MSGLTLHGRILVIDDGYTCLGVLTSEEHDGHGRPLHYETVQFMAAEPLDKGTFILEGRAERVPGARLVSVELYAPTTPAELRARENSDRLREIGDSDGTWIGLDELVEAFLIPYFDTLEDHDYWRHLVGLTCAVFGLEHHAGEIELARGQIVNSVVPLQRAMEVPQPFGLAFERHHHRILWLTTELRSLQRAFLRGALLAMEPQLEQRSTTLGRLRELGLPKRPVNSWDDM